LNNFLRLRINVPRELNNHMRISKWNYKSMFQYQISRIVYPNKCTWPISKISQVILLVLFIVLYNHVPFSDSASNCCLTFILLVDFIWVLCLKIWSWAFLSLTSLIIFIAVIPRLSYRFISDNKIIVVLPRLFILLQRPNYSASVFLVPLTWN